MDLDSLNDLVVPASEDVALCAEIGGLDCWFNATADLKKLAREICFICPLFVECRTTNDRFEIRGGKQTNETLLESSRAKTYTNAGRAVKPSAPTSPPLKATRANATPADGLFSTRTPSDSTKAVGDCTRAPIV